MPRTTCKRRPERTATLSFDEGEFAGAEVEVVINPSWAVYRTLASLLEEQSDGTDEREAETAEAAVAKRARAAAQAERFEELLALVGEEVLRGWNLVDRHDQPYPADAEGLSRQDPEFIGELLGYWYRVVTTVPPPLANGSPLGTPSRATRRAAKRPRPRQS